MAFARNGDYELFHEVVGDGERTLLLVSGFGAQAISWQDGFVDGWVERGFRVVTMDNREVGLSTKTPPSEETRYSLSDMASDCVAVLDAVGAERAHVFGNSMGGMIAQTVAIEHPGRVAALVSTMSTTGDRRVGRPSPEAMEALTSVGPDDLEGFVEHYVATSRVYSGPRFDEAWTRVRAGREHARGRYPQGAVHQMRAIVAGGDRTERLRALDVPTLVVHGRADTLIAFDGGEATAAAIPGARLLALDEMGHNLPISYWPQIYAAVTDLPA